MRTDRLEKLAAFLDSLDPTKFDITEWVNPCGTVACAMGWACQIAEFQKVGLRMVEDCPRYKVPGRFAVVSGLDAAVHFFGISHSDAHWLFMPISYGSRNPEPRDVARRIRSIASGTQRALG